MHATLSYWPLAFAGFVTLPAFALRSTAGFGGSTIFVPLLALVFPVHTVLVVVSTVNFGSAIQQTWGNWRSVVWREFARMAPFMIAGICLGLYFFDHLDDSALRTALGVFLVAYAGNALLGSSHAAKVESGPRRLPIALTAALSATGGLAGTLFGASGPFYAIYFRAMRATKDTFRMTLAMLLLVQNGVRLVGFTTVGAFHSDAWILLAVVTPCAVLATYFGDRIVARMDEQRFKQVIAALVLISGVALIFH